MIAKLVIPGRLDSLNEYTRACRSNRYAGAKMKEHNEAKIKACILTQIPEVHFKSKVYIEFAWYERNQRRDLDNVAFAKKFVLDALVTAGTLSADSWKGVRGFADSFYVDAKSPRIEVYIKDYKEIEHG